MRRRDPIRAGAATGAVGLAGRVGGGNPPFEGFRDALDDREAGASIDRAVDLDDRRVSVESR